MSFSTDKAALFFKNDPAVLDRFGGNKRHTLVNQYRRFMWPIRDPLVNPSLQRKFRPTGWYVVDPVAHPATSVKSLRMSCSIALISALISCSGRGGVYL